MPKHIRNGLIWFYADIKNFLMWCYNSRHDRIKKVTESADNKKWVFILGCNNSGTTLLYKLLEKHPEITSFPTEGQFLTSVLPVPMTLDVGRLWTEKLDSFRLTEKDDHFNRIKLIHDWMQHVKDKRAEIIIEKSPPNTIRARWLQSIFNKVYFIGIVRNGYAVSEGISRRKNVDIKRGGWHWVKSNELMIKDSKFLKNFILIRYEDLVKNPKNVVTSLLDFIGASKKEYKHDFNSRLSIHNIEKKGSYIQNFNPKSINRISEDARKELAQVIEPLMKKLGYDSRSDLSMA